MEDFREFWLPVIIIVVVSIALTVCLASWFGPASCNARFKDREHYWTMQSSCMIKTHAGWVPAANFRVQE